MKKVLTTAWMLLIASLLFAQAPQGMKYQAVARDAAGNVLPNQNICIQSSITNAAGTTTYYRETFNTITNEFGLFSLTIGSGTPVNGTFAGISWGSITPYQKIEMKIGCTGSYVLMGSSQLMSVPYALYANKGTVTTDATLGGNGSFQSRQ